MLASVASVGSHVMTSVLMHINNHILAYISFNCTVFCVKLHVIVLFNTERHKEINNLLQTIGWLNLMANVIDNFTHGLAVAGSYCVSTKVSTTLKYLQVCERNIIGRGWARAVQQESKKKTKKNQSQGIWKKIDY